MTDMPKFQLELIRKGEDALMLTCSVVAILLGFRAVTREFKTTDELEESLEELASRPNVTIRY
jgi:hypothetical protein